MRDGVILRTPDQEAAYLFVNTASEHIRFRYLHMSPRKMDANNLLSGRRVHEGEVIGEVSELQHDEGGTSYHLHFDVQVPTAEGWVFVNPVHDAGRRLRATIGARGTELADPTVVATADPASTGSAPSSSTARTSRTSRGHRGTSKHERGKRHAGEGAQDAGQAPPAALRPGESR